MVMVDTAVGDSFVTSQDFGVQTDILEGNLELAPAQPSMKNGHASARSPSKGPRLVTRDLDLVTRRAMRIKR